MGKRKAAKKPTTGKKKNEPLAIVFPCLFCNHEKSVAVKLDKKAGVGQLSCKVCNQSYQTSINYLSAAVDVYSDWVDACDAVAKGGEGESRSYAPPSAAASGRPNVSKARDERGDDDDDDIMDDEDGLGGYGGRDEGIVPDDDDGEGDY